MKTSTEYSSVKICPTTQKYIDPMRHTLFSVCPHCGHNNPGVTGHYKKVIGHWSSPSTFWEFLKGKQSVFIPLKEQK